MSGVPKLKWLEMLFHCLLAVIVLVRVSRSCEASVDAVSVIEYLEYWLLERIRREKIVLDGGCILLDMFFRQLSHLQSLKNLQLAKAE